MRCRRERGSTAVDRLTGLLDAYYGMAFEPFSKSEHMPELEETFSMLARARIGNLNTEYEDRLARSLRSLQKTGAIGGPPQGLTVEQIVRILVRAAEGPNTSQRCIGTVGWPAGVTRRIGSPGTPNADPG